MAAQRNSDVAHVHVLAEAGDDAEYLAELTSLLRDELLELDVMAVETVAEDQAPEDSKGVVAAVGGWLAVHFSPAALKSVVNGVVAWASRTGKTVELTIGGNALKVTGASADMQSKIVDEFFARLRSAS